MVVAARDPHSKGRDGVGALRAAGLRVDVGLMKSEAEALNRAFLTAQRRKRPYVIWKTAQTLDGKVASRTGASRWITGRPARSLVHELRAQSDAVLVGAGTVRTDDPALTSHGLGPDPLRLVLSRSLNLSPGARVFRGPGESWVATGPRPPRRRLQPLERAGVRVRSYPFVGKSIDLKAFLLDLFRCGVRQVLVEGTGDLSWSLLSAGLVDEVFAFYAPSFLGGAASPTALAGAGWPRPDRGPRLGEVDVRRIGEDVLVHGYLCPLRE